jgi:hypothetical protein
VVCVISGIKLDSYDNEDVAAVKKNLRQPVLPGQDKGKMK